MGHSWVCCSIVLLITSARNVRCKEKKCLFWIPYTNLYIYKSTSQDGLIDMNGLFHNFFSNTEKGNSLKNKRTILINDFKILSLGLTKLSVDEIWTVDISIRITLQLSTGFGNIVNPQYGNLQNIRVVL